MLGFDLVFSSFWADEVEEVEAALRLVGSELRRTEQICTFGFVGTLTMVLTRLYVRDRHSTIARRVVARTLRDGGVEVMSN